MFLNTLVTLAFGAMIVACGTQNVADDYLKNGGSQTAADAQPTTQADQKDETKSDTETTDDTQTETDTGMDAETPAPATGDLTKGKALLQECAMCHNSSGLAKSVTLNSAAVTRLDTAFTGKQAALHAALSESFQQPGRNDLEAALKAIK
ncbi:MAG: hypothetical protein EOP10_07395 [Proteobacteria bacterium]|nr:MAG: hypothetical protein EOP10_07395 [Pseudomonadota bacterium]